MVTSFVAELCLRSEMTIDVISMQHRLIIKNLYCCPFYNNHYMCKTVSVHKFVHTATEHSWVPSSVYCDQYQGGGYVLL
jgi:hypothetical protein